MQGILALCEFHWCEFHYCNFSKLSSYINWLMHFLANCISIVRFLAIFDPKVALAKYLHNAIFGLCDFFPGPKVALD